jgi:hypothetical protein
MQGLLQSYHLQSERQHPATVYILSTVGSFSYGDCALLKAQAMSDFRLDIILKYAHQSLRGFLVIKFFELLLYGRYPSESQKNR